MRRAHAAALACSSLLLSACVSVVPPGEPRPITGEDARIRAQLERLETEGLERRGVRALGKLRIDAPNGSGSVSEVVLAERPASLRLESLNVLGSTLSLLVTDGERFSFYDGRRLDSGLVTPEVLEDRFGLALQPAEVVELLLGAPRGLGVTPSEIAGVEQERIVHIDDQRVRLSASGELLGLEKLNPDGTLRWEALYDDWRELPGGRYPFSVALYFPATGFRLTLRLNDVELNPSLEPDLFTVPERARHE